MSQQRKLWSELLQKFELLAIILINTQLPCEIKTVDISQDPLWFDRYKYDIPVLHINNKEFCKHRFDEGKIVDFITKEQNKSL